MIQNKFGKQSKVRNPSTNKLSSIEQSVIHRSSKMKQINIGISWSYSGSSINSIVHALNGNRRIGYRVAAWNCRRGLLNFDGTPSSKVTDIQTYMYKHQLDAIGIIESDLNGVGSRFKRTSPLSTQDIHQKLHIEGYYIILPMSWQTHAQARIFSYIKDGIQVKERKLNQEDSDLPSISFEMGLGREKKTCFNFFYREFTGGVSGLRDTASQRDRLERQILHWKSLHKDSRDVAILGDSNLCAQLWMDENYNLKEFSNKVQDFLLEETNEQLVQAITRSELVAGSVQTSSIDHCYTDVREKISGPFVEAVGNSDHLGVRILKYSKTPPSRPQVIKRRVYKNFNVESFLTDILNSNINESVTTHENLETAAEAFRNEFKAILDYHAPVKTIQIRRNYCPHLKEETKVLISERNTLKVEASKHADITLMEEFKEKAKQVKKAVENDKKEAYMKDLGDAATSKGAWRTAKNLLGMTKNLAPTTLKDDQDGMITNPLNIATKLNSFFIQKVTNLRNQTDNPPTIDPVTRLQQWLNHREERPPPFKIKEISKQTLRKLIKKMKGGKSCGVDYIDSFSLKLAAPLIEVALLHIVNLSIRTRAFAKLWKHQLIFPQHKKKDKLSAKTIAQ